MKKVVFILGTGHCGSTLLDLLLGGHSKIFSLGEVNRIIKFNGIDYPCDICGEDCSFWTEDLLKRIREPFKPTIINKVRRKLDIGLSREENFYHQISLSSKKDILVDSSKNPRVIKNMGYALRNSNKFKPYLIYLSRDGRAVVNSLHRKRETDIEKTAREWNRKIEKINDCYAQWENDKIHIKYEDLALNPKKTINQITDWLQEPFEEGMMSFWKHDHHSVNGNAGTKSMIYKFRGIHKDDEWYEEDKKEYYQDKDLGIEFDERWKRELSPSQLSQIEVIISDLNARLKYD